MDYLAGEFVVQSHSKKVQIHFGAFLCGVCIFSLCLSVWIVLMHSGFQIDCKCKHEHERLSI